MQCPGGLLAGAGKEVAYATLLTSLWIMTQKKLIRRQDALMNLFQPRVDVLFFHHPAAWWISGTVRAEREHCAEDLAVRVLEAGHAGSRLSYAKALLALEERRQAHALALAANGGSLLDRIRRLAGVEEQPASPVRPLAAAVTASLLLAVLVTAAAPIREARAHELPKNTNQIESLTVEQAKKLVDEFPGVTAEVKSQGKGICMSGGCLPLKGLKKITPDVAQALSGYSKGPLLLNGLTTLDADVAKALAEFKNQELYLTGLTTLDADVAKALAGSKAASLNLFGLRTLNRDTAKALAEFNGVSLDLDGLTALSDDAATALTQYKGYRLYLNGLTTLSAEAAKALAQHKGSLYLNGLTTLSDEAAKALAATKSWDGHLPGLTALDARDSVAIAKILATRKGPLSLPNLKKVSPKTLSALIEKEDIDIPLIESLELIPEPDGSPTEDFVIPERLQERQNKQR